MTPTITDKLAEMLSNAVEAMAGNWSPYTRLSPKEAAIVAKGRALLVAYRQHTEAQAAHPSEQAGEREAEPFGHVLIGSNAASGAFQRGACPPGWVGMPGLHTVYARAIPKPADAVAVECNGLDTPERVRFYEHDFYVLSNFSAFTLMWNGILFDTSEAAYHWEKFTGDSGEAQLARHFIQTAPSAHEAFKVAEWNKAHRRPDWDDVKVDMMRNILRAKAAQHEYVRRKLLATGDRELVEDSWRDDFWGWGPNRDGQNMLGKLWMEIRAELRAGIRPAGGEGSGDE